MKLFNLFRRTEAKASVVGPMIVASSAGQAQWTRRDLQAYARDGYQQNPIVYRCVRLIVENAASLDVDAYHGKREIEDHPLLTLLARPNPFMRGKALLEAIYAHRLVTGNAFVEAVTVGGRIAELHAHRPERVKVVPGGDGYPASYEFQINGQTRRIPINASDGASTILHLKDFHPLDDWYGMSPLDPASWSVDAHAAGLREVTTTLSKGGIPVGAFQHDGDKGLTGDQVMQAREMFIDRLTQSRRDRYPAVVDRFWKWINIGQGPKELGVSELKADAAREICFAFGVPPMLLGIPGDNTYSNYSEANRAFWRETVIPFASKNLAEIGSWLGALSGEPDLIFVPDIDDIPALATERAEKWAMLNSAEFITVNERREALGYPSVDGGDKVLVASSDIPLEDAGTNLTGGEEPEDGAENQTDAEPDSGSGEEESGDRANSRARD